jgi:hypothetical protein
MAGFADSNTAQAHLLAPPNTARESPSRPTLPSGPCNYRDAAFGPCGCDQFWDKLSAELHNESAEHCPSSDRSTWCVCGHHACFHLKGSRAPEHAPATTLMFPTIQAKCDGQCQLLPGAQCDMHSVAKPAQGQNALTAQPVTHIGRYKTSHSGDSQRLLQQGASQLHEPSRTEQGWDAPSQASTSGLPSIPSVCMLSRDQHPGTDTEARYDVNQSRQTVTGLGLSMMQLESMATLNRQQSPVPTVPADMGFTGARQPSFSEPEIASTRANSFSAEAY